MPKDTRKINRSIRLSKGRGLFTEDMVDELEEVLTNEEIRSFTEAGHIEGFEVKKAEKASEKPKDK